MTPEDSFLKWLEKQIEIGTVWDNSVKAHEVSREADIFRVRVKTLEQIKEKYLSILPSPTTINHQ